MSNIFQPDQLKNSQEILNLLFWFVLNLCRYITSMQTMMRGMWARMSLRLEALQILSVNLLIRLSQPENFKTRILNFFKAKSLTTPYWIFKTCPITTEYWHHWKDIVKEKKKQHSPNDKNATKTDIFSQFAYSDDSFSVASSLSVSKSSDVSGWGLRFPTNNKKS